MADEFLESEVVFSDHRNRPHAARVDGCFDHYQDVVVSPQQQQQQQQQQNSRALRCGKKKSRRSEDRKTVANSLPVNIPERMLRCSDSDDEEGEEDGEGMVPPHVIVGRRISGGKMAFSVCTGNGRTLKGRDLSQVRNSILRMTGFLEV